MLGSFRPYVALPVPPDLPKSLKAYLLKVLLLLKGRDSRDSETLGTEHAEPSALTLSLPAPRDKVGQ